MSKAIHKEIWINHELMAYCQPFNPDYDYSEIMTSTSDNMVSCSDCQKLVSLQIDVTNMVTAN